MVREGRVRIIGGGGGTQEQGASEGEAGQGDEVLEGGRLYLGDAAGVEEEGRQARHPGKSRGTVGEAELEEVVGAQVEAGEGVFDEVQGGGGDGAKAVLFKTCVRF